MERITITKHIHKHIKYTAYALSCLLLLSFVISGKWDIRASAQECIKTPYGDTVCEKPTTNNKQTAVTGTVIDNPNGVNNSGPILDGEEADTADDLSKDLEKIIKSFPDVVQSPVLDQTLPIFEKTGNNDEKKEHLKKLADLSRKINDLAKNQCGLSNAQTSGDKTAYIHNAAANYVQINDIRNVSEGQMGKYLADLEKNICDKLTEAVGANGELVNATNDDIESHDLSQNEDSAEQLSTSPGSSPSDYAPGSAQREFAEQAEALKVSNIEGKGGDVIAECAKKMVGYKTSGIAGTNGGRLGCAIAVSKILQCPNNGSYSVGNHLSTVTLFDALKKRQVL
ncbi:MAG: hypothetical protein LRZ85_03550 [Alphaproteobacteria bacterium]|nr:hypothetical protein [Alphaproteobacteria bacterium]